MSISRRSTCTWSRFVGGLALLAVGAASGGPGPQAKGLPPFLDEFRHSAAPPATTDVRIAGVRGYLVQPRRAEEPLPALVLLPDDAGPGDWIKECAREISGIGYVVLAVEARKPAAQGSDESLLADLTSVVRWLRRRPDVAPERIGVVGWGSGGARALALAANMPVQACVSCYGPRSLDAASIAGLQATPVLLVNAGAEAQLAKALAAAAVPHEVREFPGAAPGFMQPQTPAYAFAAAEEAWVEVYNFLGKYVEDSPENGPRFDVGQDAKPAPRQIATIADIMRAVFAPTGLRGTLSRSLDVPPASEQQWKTVRAQAALIAEAGQLLDQRRPQKGAHAHWQQQVGIVAGIAEKLVAAADGRDHPAASRALVELAERCAVCHEQHR